MAHRSIPWPCSERAIRPDPAHASRIAYIDESQRDGFYALAALAVPHGAVENARRLIKTVSVSGGRRRRHFVKEEDRDRKQMLAVFRDLPGASSVCVSTTHRSVPRLPRQPHDRARRHLLSGGLDRIILDNVTDSQQRGDRQVLARVVHGTGVSYSFELPRSGELMLWVPDAVAWCSGRAGWRSELTGLVITITVP